MVRVAFVAIVVLTAYIYAAIKFTARHRALEAANARRVQFATYSNAVGTIDKVVVVSGQVYKLVPFAGETNGNITFQPKHQQL